jgi:hypothetical protein
MRIAACTVVAAVAIAGDGWAQNLPSPSQREFGLSHRPDPRGHIRFAGGDGGSGASALPGPAPSGAATAGFAASGFSTGPAGAPPFLWEPPVPPFIDGARPSRNSREGGIPDCIAR